MLIDFIEELDINDGVTMTRSYNSRKGKRGKPTGCGCFKCSVKGERAKYKRQCKANVLKFYDTLYTYKHKKKTEFKYSYNTTDPIYNEKWEVIGRKWVRKPREKSNSNWHYNRYIAPAIESYLTWSWMKGKHNKKGGRAPTGHL